MNPVPSPSEPPQAVVPPRGSALWPGLVVGALVFLAFAAYGGLAPRTYRTKAEVVLKAVAPGPLALPTNPAPVERLREAAVDAETLGQTAKELGLLPDASGQATAQQRLDSGLELAQQGPDTFDFAFSAGTATAAERVANLLARHAAARAVHALSPPAPNPDAEREAARAKSAADLAAFMAAHPELTPAAPAVVPVTAKDVPETDAAALRAERDQIQAKLSRIPEGDASGDSDNPFGQGAAASAELTHMRRRIAEIDQLLKARQHSDKKPDATPKVSPDVEREWKRLVRAVADPVVQLAVVPPPAFTVMLREATLPSTPLVPNLHLITLLGALGALASAAVTMLLFGALRRGSQTRAPAGGAYASEPPPRPASEPPRPGSEPPRPSSELPRPGSNPPLAFDVTRPSSDPPGVDRNPTLGTNPTVGVGATFDAGSALGTNASVGVDPPLGAHPTFDRTLPIGHAEPARPPSDPPRPRSDPPQPIIAVTTQGVAPRATSSNPPKAAATVSSAPLQATRVSSRPPKPTAIGHGAPSAPQQAAARPPASPVPPAPSPVPPRPTPGYGELGRGQSGQQVLKGTLVGMAPLDARALTGEASAATTGSGPPTRQFGTQAGSSEATAPRSTLRPPPPDASNKPVVEVTTQGTTVSDHVTSTPVQASAAVLEEEQPPPGQTDEGWTGPSRAHRRSMSAARRTTQMLGSPIAPVVRGSRPPAEREPSAPPPQSPRTTTYSYVSSRPPEAAPQRERPDTPPYYQPPRTEEARYPRHPPSTPRPTRAFVKPAAQRPRVSKHPVRAGWAPDPTLDPGLRRALADELFPLAIESSVVIGVTSVGEVRAQKSRIAAELALALAEPRHPRVLLLEADFQWAAVHQVMHVDMPMSAGLSQQLRGMTPDQPMTWTVAEVGPTLHVLAEGVMRSPGLILSRQFEDGIHSLRAYYDLIVLDGPDTWSEIECRALSNVTDAIVVVAPARGAPELARAAELFPDKRYSTVVGV